MPFSTLPPRLVDRLPQRWWALGNLYQLRVGPDVHLCFGPLGQDGRSVRTIEVANRIVAWGRVAFDYDASERDGVAYSERFDRKWGLTHDDLADDPGDDK